MILLLTIIRPPFFFMLGYFSGNLPSYGSHDDNSIHVLNSGGDCSIDNIIFIYNVNINGSTYLGFGFPAFFSV